MGGFSYRGRNISSFGTIFYIPEADERGDYALPYSVFEEEITGRDGEYYYGNRAQAREWTLTCYYEGLSQRDQEDIIRWFGRNTKGRLIFDDRPYAYYDVIPNGRVMFQPYKVAGCDAEYKG